MPNDPDPAPRTALTPAQRWMLGGVAAVVALLLAVVAAFALGGDDESTATTTTTTSSSTTTEPTTTTGSTTTTTTTTTFTPEVDPYDVAFPSPNDSRRFQAPEPAAQAYATDVLGFTEVVLGAADEGATGATEVVVQDRADGPKTRIELIQHDGGAWYVAGSSTDDIAVTQPTPGASLATPFETTGEALAFEGAVEVLVLAQGDPAPLGSGTVTGSGVPPAGPFSGQISYTPPAEATPGVLVYRIRSPEDGRVVQATSFRARLTPLSS